MNKPRLARWIVLLSFVLLPMVAVAKGESAAHDDAGPAPLDPYPAGPLAARTIPMGMMVFHSKSGVDLEALFARLAGRYWPGLHVLGVNAPPVGPTPRVQAGLLPVVPPDRTSLEENSHGLAPADRDVVRGERKAFVMGFLSTPQGWLADCRRAEKLVQAFAEQAQGWIWDPQTRECFTPAAFAAQRSTGWLRGKPLVTRHLTIRYPREGERGRIMTRGMAQFGLPDLVIVDPPPGKERDLGLLLLVATDAMLAKPKLNRTGALDVNLRDVLDPQLSQQIAKRKQGPGSLTLVVLLGEGVPKVNRNRLLEIRPTGTNPSWDPVLERLTPVGAR